MTPDRWQKRQDANRFQQFTGGSPSPVKMPRRFTANELRDSGEKALIELHECEAENRCQILHYVALMSIEELQLYIETPTLHFSPFGDADLIPAFRKEYAKRLASAFQKHHEITTVEFKEEYWQVLFAIEHPEAQS